MPLGHFQIGVIDLLNQSESSARHYCFALARHRNTMEDGIIRQHRPVR
jgi:hypothetical protein